jgi:cytosine/uracil/thiamine/allantoin permease
VKDIVFSPLGQYLICLAGMLVHFLKKEIKGETITEVKDYFRDHPKNTVIAFIATTVAFAAYHFQLSTGGNVDLIVVFTTGYTFDSIFNKYDGVS